MTLDFGQVYSLAGAAMTTAYQTNATPLNCGRVGRVRWYLRLATITPGSNVTAALAEVWGSRDGVSYEQLNLQLDDLSIANEQSFALVAAGTPQESSFTCDGGWLYLQPRLKVAGGAGQAGESLALSALGAP